MEALNIFYASLYQTRKMSKCQIEKIGDPDKYQNAVLEGNFEDSKKRQKKIINYPFEAVRHGPDHADGPISLCGPTIVCGLIGGVLLFIS